MNIEHSNGAQREIQPVAKYITPEEASRRLGGALAAKTIKNKFWDGRWGAREGVCRIGRRVMINWEVFEPAVVNRQ